MAVQPVPVMTPVPHFPALSERAAGTYNSSAYAFGTHMADTFNGELLAVAENVRSNAAVAESATGAAASAAADAQSAANAAALSATAADSSEAAALAYAQAAGASAGVPTPTPNKVLSTDASGVVAWRDAPSDPTVANKLDKSGGVATKLAYTYLDHGTIAAGGTVNISALTATVHRVQAAGNLTITFADMITGSLSGDIELHCVNFGGKTVTWPAGNWVKNDGSYAAAVGNSGVTWQAAGTDRVLVMIDNGAITYKVMR